MKNVDCAGIRWLFRKKQIAEYNHKMTWRDAVHEYKGHTAEAELGMGIFDDFYMTLKERQ